MDSRKASDILLSIEQKLDQLLLVITANDLTMKVIANKLQNLIDKNQNISALPVENFLPTASILSPEKEEIDINSEFNIQEEKNPSGVRRTSRSSSDSSDSFFTESRVNKNISKIPITQRVVDKNGKSLFLADVEFFNEKSETVEKVKTNSVGKYQAQLFPGNYKVIIKKLEPLSKAQLESVQTISVDDNISILELPMIIIK